MKKRIALSLFHGMGCFNIALEKCGVKFESVYVSEVDKFAIKEDKENNPENIHLGDVIKWREWDIDWAGIDLLIGGSPCQGFSFAGKQLAFDDPRSALFFVYVDILNHVKSVNPNVKFMLENVRMKKEYLDVITEHLGVQPINIESNTHTAVDRNRFYWCNWPVTQPKENDICFGDIREWGVKDGSVYYSKAAFNWLTNHAKRKGKDFKIYTTGGKFQMLEASMYKKYSSQRFFGVLDSEGVRYPTVVEGCRLHGVPDNYFKVSSNTQAYKMLGNGWQCDTIEHIFNCLFNGE